MRTLRLDVAEPGAKQTSLDGLRSSRTRLGLQSTCRHTDFTFACSLHMLLVSAPGLHAIFGAYIKLDRRSLTLHAFSCEGITHLSSSYAKVVA